MKRILSALLAATILASCIYPALAAPQLGITPCQISAQPSDLSFSGTSANKRMSTCGETVIVYNNSANDVRYRLGTASNTTALLTDLLLPANSFVVLNVGLSQLYFAAISSGTGTISFVQGTANS
jgi:hypothetical protein